MARPEKLNGHVYRCTAWYLSPESQSKAYVKGHCKGTPTKAYGEWPERLTSEQAYDDLVALRATAMKNHHFGSMFFATVIEYPAGGVPPLSVERQLFFHIADPE